MRWRRFIGPALVVLLAVVAAGLWWQTGRGTSRTRRHDRVPAPASGITTASSQSGSATKAPLLTGQFTNTSFKFLSQISSNAPDPVSKKPEDRFKYRLSNTRQTIDQLVHNPKAVLLENALYDTSGSFSNLNIPPSLLADGDPQAYIVQSKTALDDRIRC